MMRVVLAGTGMVRVPPERGGAIESHLVDLYRVLRARGQPVTLVSDVRDARGFEPGEVVPASSPVDRFPLRPVASAAAHAVGGLLVARACGRFLDRMPRDSPVLLHLHEEVSAALLARTHPRVRKVFTLHNPPGGLGRSATGVTERTLRAAGSLLTRKFVVRRVDLVLVATTTLRDHLVEEWDLPPERVGVLPLAVDTNRYTPGASEPGPTELLYVGRLDARKNVASLLEMMDGLDPEIHLTMVGDGPLRGAVRRAIDRNGWQARVELLPRLTADRLVEVYRRSTIFVFPSRLETYGRVIVEAAACGLPVVLPELPIYRDFIDRGFTVPFPEQETGGLRDAVEGLHAEERRRRLLSRRARRFALENNSLPVFGSRLLREYGRVAG